MNRNTLLIITTLFIIACQPKKTEDENVNGSEPMTEQSSVSILGQWVNLSMTVKYGSKDSTAVVAAGKWEEVLGIKPILTTYTEDGNFTSEYRNLNDSLVGASKGQWALEGDTLSLTEEGTTTKYHFSFDKNEAVGEFTGYIDWDRDGQSNDLYSGKQRKLVKE